MISGEVTPDREAIIHLQVAGPGGSAAEIVAVLDTGFTENLALPPALIVSLGLARRGAADFILAGGISVRLRLFRASVLWHGQQHSLLVVETDGGPLVGMRLLHGNRVTLDVVDGGDVTIEPLP
jgi:predicted aspartyl protease